MLTREERALAKFFADELVSLYVERERVVDTGDLVRVHTLQVQIMEAAYRRRGWLAQAAVPQPSYQR